MPPKKVTQVGRGRKKAGQAMKKVGKRGAYNKNVKSQMVMRRAPLVETKQRVHSDVAQINGYPVESAGNITNPLNWRSLAPDDAFTNIPLRSWTRISQGFGENQCIGQSIFSKFLNFKLEVRFPDGKDILWPDGEGGTLTIPNKMIEKPTKLYLVCGWITAPMNYPLSDDTSPSLPAQSDATQTALDAYITQQLKPFFDDDEDKLQFRPKQTTNIKIEKYVKISPNLDKAIGSQATPYQQWSNNLGENVNAIEPHGSIPDVYRSWSVKTNRKIPLTEGLETTFPVDKQNLFPNNSYVPFAVIYNPQYEFQAENWKSNPETGKLTQIQVMEYRYNDAHYYTDS